MVQFLNVIQFGVAVLVDVFLVPCVISCIGSEFL